MEEPQFSPVGGVLSKFFEKKLFLPEGSFLKQGEKFQGYTWVQLHSFKSLAALPLMPPAMPVESISTRIDSCNRYVEQLDHCISYFADNFRPKYPYERMFYCKPIWVKLTRCVRLRDNAINRQIQKWERGFIEKLEVKHKEKYTEDLKSKLAYHEYMLARTPDEWLQYTLSKQTTELRDRVANLMGSHDVQKGARQRWVFSRGQGQDPHAPMAAFYQAGLAKSVEEVLDKEEVRDFQKKSSVHSTDDIGKSSSL